MILAVDVQYIEEIGVAAGILFESWLSETSTAEYIATTHNIEAYEPGQFYKRELPCILNLLKEHQLSPEIIVVDGYVYLDGDKKPGLGFHLYNALDQNVEIIGVAKKPFTGISEAHEVYRGESQKPLYVTSTSKLEPSKQQISQMFGKHRIPTLLKRADQLCREESK